MRNGGRRCKGEMGSKGDVCDMLFLISRKVGICEASLAGDGLSVLVLGS